MNILEEIVRTSRNNRIRQEEAQIFESREEQVDPYGINPKPVNYTFETDKLEELLDRLTNSQASGLGPYDLDIQLSHHTVAEPDFPYRPNTKPHSRQQPRRGKVVKKVNKSSLPKQGRAVSIPGCSTSIKSPDPSISSPPSASSATQTEPFSLEALKSTKYCDAAWLCTLFNPYLRDYLFKSSNSNEWLTKHARLYIQHLQSAFEKGTSLSWKSSYITPAIGLDLDFHDSEEECWSSYYPSKKLSIAYYSIISHFDQQPSLVCRSPRGIHIYYFLNSPMNYFNLKTLTEYQLNYQKIEMKPSPTTGLRIPTRQSIINPRTLMPVKEGLIKWEEIPLYSPEDLLGSTYQQILVSLNHNTPKEKTSLFPLSQDHSMENAEKGRNWENILRLESELLPFKNGHTNDILCQLVPKYRTFLSFEDSLDRIHNHILNSLEYTNDLTDYSILERRIQSFYRNGPSITSSSRSISKIIELPEHLEAIIQSQKRFVKQRTKGIRKYFFGLLSWKAYHDSIYTNKARFYEEDSKYPYYAVNRKKGYYPLPSSKQKEWNKNYNSLLPWLKEIGILEESGFSYSPRNRICKYYRINLP